MTGIERSGISDVEMGWWTSRNSLCTKTTKARNKLVHDVLAIMALGFSRDDVSPELSQHDVGARPGSGRVESGRVSSSYHRCLSKCSATDATETRLRQTIEFFEELSL